MLGELGVVGLIRVSAELRRLPTAQQKVSEPDPAIGIRERRLINHLDALVHRLTRARDLLHYEQQYRELAAQLPSIGMIHSGSVTRRYTRCATPGCKCHADPPQPHGPYYQWTAKINGKTVTRRISEREAELYQEWIANDRQLRDLIDQMRQIAAKVAELTLKQAADA